MAGMQVGWTRALLAACGALLIAGCNTTAPTSPVHAAAKEGSAVTRPSSAAASPVADARVAQLYAVQCATCHGTTRLGGMGPALLPENLGRMKAAQAVQVIAEGRPGTQMPGFAAQLSAGEIDALARHVLAPPAMPVRWSESDIRASRIVALPMPDPGKPVYDTPDVWNLFVVVELGDHHVTIFDGTKLQPIARVATRPNLHGGPKFSPNGRFVYFASRDGWISKFDLYTLRTVAEIRAGINTRNAAVSSDGRWVLVGNYLPATLVVLHADDLQVAQVLDVAGADGKPSRVSAVYDAAPRGSFVAALKDVPQLWELPYAKRSAVAAPRKVALSDQLDDFFFDAGYRKVIGSARDGAGGRVVDIETGRDLATLALTGLPHLGSGITWNWNGRTVMATPNLREGGLTIIDTADWKVVEKIPTSGPGFFLRSHETTPYAWADTFFGKPNDSLLLIDKKTLKVAHTLTPMPGKTAAHTEFTRDGRYALVSVWDDAGALVVYDAKTLAEVRRFPMKKPSGKYNVWNKVNRSEGTSH